MLYAVADANQPQQMPCKPQQFTNSEWRVVYMQVPLEQQMAASTSSSRRSLNGNRKKPIPQKVVTSIVDGLKQVYFQKVSRDAVRDSGSLIA